jgi:hypothetical protein
MYLKYFKITAFVLLFSSYADAQVVSTNIPAQINKSGKYLFYLHGQVVTLFGNNAINQSAPEWGPYEYLAILDSLKNMGFTIISENRKEGVDNSVYAAKIKAQVDTLLQAGVKAKNIILVGASSGWEIILQVDAVMKNKRVKYVVMGGCWPDTYKSFTNLTLYGNYLSIIETSDPHGTCSALFSKRKSIRSYKEVVLNTGLSHGFFYKGRKEWIDPIMHWFAK